MSQDYRELISKPSKTKVAAERTCAFCGKPFTPRWLSRGPTRRKYCYRPKCELGRERVKREHDKERKRQLKNGIRN